MTKSQPLILSIKPSQILWLGLIVLHVVALLACWLSAVAMPVQALLTLLICFNLQKIIYDKTRRGQSCRLQYNAKSGWQLAEHESNYQIITLLPSTVVTRLLIVIHYQTPKQSWKSLIVMRDSLTFENYRQLIVKLKVSVLTD